MRARIPWLRRLQTQLMLATVALALALAAGYWLVERGFQSALQAQATSGAALFSETLLSTTRRAMLEDRRQAVYDAMGETAGQPGVERVRLFNKAGRITFSTDAADQGRVFTREDAACAACHQAPRPLSRLPVEARRQLLDSGGHRVVTLVTPIYNEDSCASAACHRHSRSEQVLGLVEVDLSLAEADQRIATFREVSALGGVAGVALIGFLLVVVARRRVVRPVEALLEGTRRVAEDDLEAQIPVISPGELGALARSFNEMTRALRRTQDEVTELNRDLEARVAERTAELERAHAALVHTEKLSSLGQLAASIAHEINNPLAGILTYAKLLAREAEQDVPDEGRRRATVKRLDLVRRETERCSAIVRNLLDFARERPLKMVAVDLHAVVKESLQLVGHKLQLSDIAVEVHLDPVPAVSADFGELRQAVVNLALNALEAMGKGGRLTVTTRTGADGAVEVAVSDSGPGVPAEIREKIFDPFFTTKEKGTGLGLSVVFGILQRHGGKVVYEDAPGGGACFVLRLPVLPLVQAGPPGEQQAG
ncbi:MAG: ATP-binding protein [Anaeromyxobacter sp.]